MPPFSDTREPRQYFGKYRGVVVNNEDPKELGRVQVSVPAILGDVQSCWAMPCVPYAGPGVGFFAVPPIDAKVWVEFEAGNLDFPIWTGCFWDRGDVPAQPATPNTTMLKTRSITLTLSDVDDSGGVVLEVAPPAVSQPLRLIMDSNGIELQTPRGALKLTEEEAILSQSPVALTLSPTSIELESGSAQIEMSTAAVRINGDALEVI